MTFSQNLTITSSRTSKSHYIRFGREGLPFGRYPAMGGTNMEVVASPVKEKDKTVKLLIGRSSMAQLSIVLGSQ